MLSSKKKGGKRIQSKNAILKIIRSGIFEDIWDIIKKSESGFCLVQIITIIKINILKVRLYPVDVFHYNLFFSHCFLLKVCGQKEESNRWIKRNSQKVVPFLLMIMS